MSPSPVVLKDILPLSLILNKKERIKKPQKESFLSFRDENTDFLKKKIFKLYLIKRDL
jgi:hypothetical protein